ncbi:selenium-dependent molybdenum cofactor biosynthesis protein YqeB [Oceanispirochaeta sp.]|jgi:xanthine dehydrogenase accessory factor|uniref:selenium-dependent molybdenum cofactor biosynthesis protein YqeB n=1 Tax=Oceanispirochaeta sp. TaxID=2035350 RepID=UPI002634370C|nr:selenium-dependent molybdenum cofactor biosynthesis protein YqeB [Oceanispirochaeta sp.]MDA3958143.1 selenium-dependent molybdenum cofactor biosynthesis protein YqeB [Oceanispirochaeta sp.]
MSLFTKAAELEKQNRSFALITITASEGSAPRNSGRMILLNDGSILGTIGGGPAEKLVIEEGLKCLKAGVSRSVSYKLDSGTSSRSINMVCGGNMEFFIEVFLPRPALFLAGGGHVNLALAELAEKLDYPYVVADSRPEIASRERFPRALDHICEPDSSALFSEALARGLIDSGTSLIIATHNHDETALAAALRTESSYIGMLGSKRKVRLFLNKMSEAGFSDKDLERVYSPIGLDLGAETPHEIAISILAEIMMLRTGSSGKSMTLLPKAFPPEGAPLIIVRGAGDIASGVICRLHNSGFRVAALETNQPTVIRRTVSFADALRFETALVEGIQAVKTANENEISRAFSEKKIPILADPQGLWIEKLKPLCVVDAILAKKNLGTRMDMAAVVIGLGPGFTAGEDVHAVIETNRGHSLGQVILKGQALKDTGIPGTIGGYSSERVIRAPASGIIEVIRDIESLVKKGEVLARIGKTEVLSPLDGVVRGMIAPGTLVKEGLKMADVDPRGETTYCHQVSDKARAIAGGVLEALLQLTPRLLTGRQN